MEHEVYEIENTSELLKTVFVSFANPDRALAEEIARYLTYGGFQCWIEGQNLLPGTADWETEIRNGIRDSEMLLVVVSRNTIGSKYVRSEIALAVSKGLPVLPVWVSGNEWAECAPMEIIGTQYIDLRDDCADFINKNEKRLWLRRHEEINDHVNSIVNYEIHDVVRVLNFGTVGSIPEKSGVRTTTDTVPPGYIAVALQTDRENAVQAVKDCEEETSVGYPGWLFRAEMNKPVGGFLNSVFEQQLHKHFPIFSYGDKWCLRSGRGGFRDSILICPSSGKVDLQRLAVEERSLWWAGNVPSTFRKIPVACDNAKFFWKLFHHPKFISFALRSGNYERVSKVEAVEDKDLYLGVVRHMFPEDAAQEDFGTLTDPDWYLSFRFNEENRELLEFFG